MKKIVDYRKLLGVNEAVELPGIKKGVPWPDENMDPDKFHNDADGLEEAEHKSKAIIEAYHFLVSIAPETRNQTISAYNLTTTTSGMVDFEYRSQTLKVYFADGNAYEYLDVPKAAYVKLVNADSPGRFARRHIFNAYVYRSLSKLAETA